MDTRFTNLFAAMKKAISGEYKAQSGTLPSPWESWTLISLIWQRQRQLWARAIVWERLNEANGQGTVPDLPEWEYFFHGIGCSLTHRVTGEKVEADTGEGFDIYCWLDNLRSCKSPNPATRRMIELHPSFESLWITLTDLNEAGAINWGEDEPTFALSEEAIDLFQGVEELCERPCDQSSHKALRDLVEPDTSEVRERNRRKRLERALDLLETEALSHEALFVLADLRPADLSDRLTEALFRTPYSRLNSAAMEIVEKTDDTAWCEAVYRLWKTVQPHEATPQPYLWITSTRFLLRHGYRTAQLVIALPLAGATDRGEAALLALEFGQDLKLPSRLFLDAFLKADSTANSRVDAAAALAVLDSSWSREILKSVLWESTDAETTTEARVALRESRDPVAHAAAEYREEANLPRSTKAAVKAAILADDVKLRMQELHDRVLPLRRKC